MQTTTPKHTTRKGLGDLLNAFTPNRILLLLLAAVVGALLSVIGFYGVSALTMYYHVTLLADASESLANTALGCGGDKDVVTASRELAQSARALQSELNKPKWTFVRDHTAYGNDIDAIRALLDSVASLVDGPFSDAADLAPRLSGFSMKNRSVDLSALADLPDIVKHARSEIKADSAKLDKLAQPKLGVTSRLLQAGKSGLRSADSLLDEYDELVDLIPQLLGVDSARTYLAVIYNPAELRSGGGMVGNIAAITADDGKVTIGDFTATTNLEYGTEPFDEGNVEEAEVFGEWIWRYPQTTTMNPNFQRAAVTLKNLWKAQKGNEHKTVAGVVALDPAFLQSLIGATGAVTLSDGTELDGTNTTEFFLNRLYVDHPKYEEQNAYTNKASQTIMEHVFSNANASTVSELLKAIRDSSADSHFKLWMAQDEELAALVQTGVLDPNVSGMLPGDEKTPVSGVYLSEMVASKLDWYLDAKVKVTKTCGDTFASQQTYLDGGPDAPAMATDLGLLSEADLGDEYTVVVTLHNTLTKEQVKSLPTFVTGEDDPGTMELTVMLMAPAGGEITSIAYDNASYSTNGMVSGRQFVVLNAADGIAPGRTETIAYTVRAAEQATAALNVVTTPVITASGTYTGSNGEVTDKCGADVPDAAEDALIGAGDEAGDEANGNSGAGDSATGGDSAVKPNDSSQDDKNATSTSGSGGGKSGSVLDSLGNLANQIECPVDLKKLAR